MPGLTAGWQKNPILEAYVWLVINKKYTLGAIQGWKRKESNLIEFKLK